MASSRARHCAVEAGIVAVERDERIAQLGEEALEAGGEGLVAAHVRERALVVGAHLGTHRVDVLHRLAVVGPVCSGVDARCGGGIESTCGGASAHTSSTRHGAWSTTKRAAGPEAVRAQSRVVAVAREHEDVHPVGGRHHLALDAPAAALHARRRARSARAASASSASAASSEIARSGAGAPWAAAGRRRPSSAVARSLGQRLDVAGSDVQQRHLGVGGQERGGLGDRRLPGVLHDPDERAHLRSGPAR